MRNYIALIHKDPDSDYSVSFPDLPGCITAGVTIDQARTMAEEALALHLEGLAEDGQPIPAPSSLEDIMSDPENRSAVAALIPAPVQTVRTVRVNITLPENVLSEVDTYAESKGYTRSGFLLLAAKKAMNDAA